MIHKNLLHTIGNTPLVGLEKVHFGFPGGLCAKMEAFNPGQSAKDRIVMKMLELAEEQNLIHPGFTITEATSGNTGISLAIACRVKGYRCVLCVKDKISKEKLNLLKALGAKVVLCPSKVGPDDPKSYYNRAKQLSEEIPNAYYLNQNFNTLNQQAHYETTGKEIWEQSEGRVTYFLASMGTCGTISGIAKYLKEQNEKVHVIGVDAFGSALSPYFKKGEYSQDEIYSTRMTGVGKNIIPGNADFQVIDEIIQVRDFESAVQARRLAKVEGILGGYSAGAVLEAYHQIRSRLTKDDLVVLLFSDHGVGYLSTIYNDQWMEQQFGKVGFEKNVLNGLFEKEEVYR